MRDEVITSKSRGCFFWPTLYTWTHWKCGQFRSYLHENFEKFKMISTPMGNWIRSRRRRDRIQLPVGVETISNFSKFHADRDGTVHTLSGFKYNRSSHHRRDRLPIVVEFMCHIFNGLKLKVLTFETFELPSLGFLTFAYFWTFEQPSLSVFKYCLVLWSFDYDF